MNTNLKIALLLGFEIVYYGWTAPGMDEDDYFKVCDNDDYGCFDYTDPTRLLAAVTAIENKYQVCFEFQRIDKIFKMITVHGTQVDVKNIQGATLVELLRNGVEAVFTGAIDEKMELIKQQHGGHYYGIMKAEDCY